jgi:phosphatidylglycerophosphate synthase
MPNFNYFAEQEQAGQERFQKLRDRLLGPVIRLLIACRISADVISLLGMLQLVPFGYLLLQAAEPRDVAFATIFLWLHVILDAVDGPIARATGNSGPAGAFTDMCGDHTGMLITSCLLAAAGLADGTLTTVYVSFYTLAVVFTICLNVIKQPFRLVIRTKYLLYALISFYGISGTNILNEALYAFCAIHIVFSLAGFLKLRRVLCSSEVDLSDSARIESPESPETPE